MTTDSWCKRNPFNKQILHYMFFSRNIILL